MAGKQSQKKRQGIGSSSQEKKKSSRARTDVAKGLGQKSDNGRSVSKNYVDGSTTTRGSGKQPKQHSGTKESKTVETIIHKDPGYLPKGDRAKEKQKEESRG